MYDKAKTVLKSTFMQKFIKALDVAFYKFWHNVWFKFLDYTISLLFPTTLERLTWNKKLNLTKFIALVPFLVILSPFGFGVYIIWLILMRKLFRTKPYRLLNQNKCLDLKFDLWKTYQVLSTNICLFPEILARLNNQCDTQTRLKKIGKILVKGEYDENENYLTSVDEIDKFVQISDNLEAYSHKIDFLCVQEVWTLFNARKLKNLLIEKYPHIVYDVGINTFKSNCFIGLDSGLMFCSKYPIMNVDFKTFSSKVKACKFSSKGLLIAKVFLGNLKNGKKVIGFISNTHLQSYQGVSNVHTLQMNETLEWLTEFRYRNTNKATEVVAFDLICGDFNLDNYSPVDIDDINHKLFQSYNDPMTLKPFKDHPDSIGTEMRHFSLYDESIATPEKLKKALTNERLRRWYIYDANIKDASFEMLNERPKLAEDGLPVLLPEISGKRRVDRILYNRRNKIDVKNYKFITSFARLTDHIPIAMEFSVAINQSFQG